MYAYLTKEGDLVKCPICGEETERIINICDTKIKVKVMCSCRIKEQEEKSLYEI